MTTLNARQARFILDSATQAGGWRPARVGRAAPQFRGQLSYPAIRKTVITEQEPRLSLQ